MGLNGKKLTKFNDFSDALRLAECSRVNRAAIRDISSNSNKELHIFTDASLKAYGAVIYLRESSPNNPTRVTLLMAKARVAPLKGKWNIHL